MPLNFQPVATERAEQLLVSGGSRGQGLSTIKEFLRYVEQSGENSAEISVADFGKVTVKNEDGTETQRELRPSEIVTKIKSAALSHNYAVTAVADAGNVVLIRTEERPDTSRAEGTAAPRKEGAAKPGRKSSKDKANQPA